MNPTSPLETTRDVSEFEVLEFGGLRSGHPEGLFSHEDHRRFSQWGETIGPSGGSKLVAKVWTGGAHALMPTGSSRTTIFGLACRQRGAGPVNRSATATLLER